MNLTLRALLCVSVLGASYSSAKADGPTDYPGYDEGDPSQFANVDNSQVYQPPPEGVCFDDENQSYDCSKDEDYQSYSNIDDGYDPNAHEDFRDALAPYGQWVQSPQYGNVWVPSQETVGSDFTPYYSGGRWNYTDYGWTWVSEYNWGWAPFHYGRWITLPGYGWSWVPGRIWGPAWVHWRSGGGHVGWAPLPPRGMVIARPVYGSRWNHWNFVASHQILSPRLIRVAPPALPGLWGRTTITTDFRSIGSMRVVVGPPLHHFPGVRVVPAPLGSLQIALPRSNIVVRPGVPLVHRTYYTPYSRPQWGGGPVAAPRPGYPPVYQRPGYPPPYQRPGQPPIYNRPGWEQRPSNPPPYQQRPGWEQRPGNPPPYQQRPGWEQRPGNPPPYQQPGQVPPYQQRPGWEQRPQPLPGQQPPVFQHPGGGPEQHKPGWEPRPMPQPTQPPTQPPIYQRPSFEQRPQPMPQPAPTPTQPPIYQRPSFEQRPQPMPQPMPRPSFEQRPQPAPMPQPMPRPSFEQRPQPMPQPMPRPSFEQRPQPMPQPMPRPSFEQRPQPMPRPSFEQRPQPAPPSGPVPAPGPGGRPQRQRP